MSININSDCKLLLYADDSTIMLTQKNQEFISQELGEELEPSSEWLINNKLSRHLGKRECILFAPQRKLKTVADFRINSMVIKENLKVVLDILALK